MNFQSSVPLRIRNQRICAEMLYLQTDILDLNRPFPFRFLFWSRCSLPQSCMDPDPGLTGIMNPHRNIRIPCHIRIMRFECPAVGMAADHDVFDFEMPHGILKSRRKDAGA